MNHGGEFEKASNMMAPLSLAACITAACLLSCRTMSKRVRQLSNGQEPEGTIATFQGGQGGGGRGRIRGQGAERVGYCDQAFLERGGLVVLPVSLGRI